MKFRMALIALVLAVAPHYNAHALNASQTEKFNLALDLVETTATCCYFEKHDNNFIANFVWNLTGDISVVHAVLQEISAGRQICAQTFKTVSACK